VADVRTTAPIAIDLETDLLAPGVLAPAPVIGSEAEVGQDARLVTLDEIRSSWPAKIRSTEMVLGANLPFDLLILVNEGVITIDDAFDLYEQGRAWDVQVAQALDAIADGMLFKNPVTGQPLQAANGKRARYSLDTCTRLTLGRDDAKVNDYYRKRYAILRHVPLDDWPEEARVYPVDDARNTRDVAIAQASGRKFGPLKGDGPLKNLHDLTRQSRAAWALHLASAWGIRTDPERVAALRASVDAAFEAAVRDGQAAGFLREDGTEDQAKVKRAVALAYGASGACERCGGAGKVASTVTGKPVGCKGADGGCDGTGLDLATAPGLTRTPTGGVSASRDTLEESGDDTLERYGHITEIEKQRSAYLPFVEAGTTWPIIPRPNVLVETGRTSYDGVMQTFPKKGGLRECFVPRPGYVFCSIDYAALELCSLAQVLHDLIGENSIADAINESKDPGALHTALGARMLGLDVEAMTARMKAGDAIAKGFRQAAKAANFGFPGGMGAVTFVLAKRKRIEGETVAADGTVYAGIRLCILMTGAERCGGEKVSETKGRTHAPVCRACVACAEDLRNEWFGQWPEMRQYFTIVSSIADTGQMVQLRSQRVRGGIDFTNTANGYFQGLAADGAKDALWRVSKECYTDRRSPMFGARPLFFAHDEVFSEIPEPIAHRAAPRMAKVMRETMSEWLPDVYVDAQPALMRRWSKDAATVYVDGKLVPDPKVA
jgi:DNA polymerase-1